jgi:hypothetical protein
MSWVLVGVLGLFAVASLPFGVFYLSKWSEAGRLSARQWFLKRTHDRGDDSVT